ncbi:MAG: hypothetical protein ABI589_07480 [Burkholderiales bacterium]
MATARIGYQIATLETARECALLGAHPRTIAMVTGLAPDFIRRSVFDATNRAPRGRPRYEDDYIFRAPLRFRAEACAVARHYAELIENGFSPARSLISAYSHQSSSSEPLMLAFDEAFHLIARLHGLWSTSTRTLQLVKCERCGSPQIAPAGPFRQHGCRFCKLLLGPRAVEDSSSAGPSSGVPSRLNRMGRVASQFGNQIAALRFERKLVALGAHKRVVSALMSSYPETPPSLRRPAPSALVRLRQPLSLHRWSAVVAPLHRASYSLLAKHYRDQVDRGIVPEHAIVAAFLHTAELCPSPLNFNRCFEVASLFTARWGVAEQALTLRSCRKCASMFILSPLDRDGAHCPFCTLLRFPTRYFGSDQAATFSTIEAFPAAIST